MYLKGEGEGKGGMGMRGNLCVGDVQRTVVCFIDEEEAKGKV
jgi:hypothetical protein